MLVTFVRRRLNTRDEGGFALIVAIGILLICGLLVAAALAATREDTTLTHTYSNEQRAYFAAIAGIDAYKYQLSVEPNYWTKCPKTTEPLEVPGDKEEKYTYETLPSESSSVCKEGTLSTIVESSGSASGTFRIKATGRVPNSKCGKNECTREIVATLDHASFLDYAFVSNFEEVDPATVGATSLECEHYYKEREELHNKNLSLKCVGFPWIEGDAIEGPFHTNDAADISGKPVFGRAGHTDPIEMKQGYYGGTPVINGKLKDEKVPTLLPPEANAELIREAGTKYTGRTVIILKGSTMEVKNSTTGTLPSVAIPTNGVIAIVDGSGSCPNYTPFFPSYTSDKECGDVYVSGKYTSSLTIIAENDVIINGNITTEGGETGGEPTGTATLGLVADKYVRLYHPVMGPCETQGETTSTCKVKESPAGSAEYECSVGNAESTTVDAVTEELGKALKNPIIDAAILSTNNSWGVDNFACPSTGSTPTLQTIKVWGSIAEDWRGRVTCCAAGGDYLKSYKWDPRLENDQPPKFLAPRDSEWDVERETAPPEENK
jgi:hypothetical protein